MLELDVEGHKWKDIILVPGNHDKCIERYYDKDKPINTADIMRQNDVLYYPKHLTIMVEGAFEVQGLRFFAWAYVPNLPNWAFHMVDADAEKYLNREFKDIGHVDILISHGPPRNILDYVNGMWPAVGSNALNNLPFTFDKHIFGHIHECRKQRTFRTIELPDGDFKNVYYYNVCQLTGHYEPDFEPLILIMNGENT